MKLSILDYNQKIAVSFGLDMNDLILIRWFIDYRNTDEMNEVIFDGKAYYWVNYKKVIEDLPILKIKNENNIKRGYPTSADAPLFFLLYNLSKFDIISLVNKKTPTKVWPLKWKSNTV